MIFLATQVLVDNECLASCFELGLGCLTGGLPPGPEALIPVPAQPPRCGWYVYPHYDIATTASLVRSYVEGILFPSMSCLSHL